ncbi:MAG: hypothetical protein WCJ57_04075, partial [Candidatus Falkowbacteria bacterium]
MNNFKKFLPLFIFIILVAGFLLPMAHCSAGLLATSSGITSQTDTLRDSAGFDQNMALDDIIALIIRVALSILGIIFLVLLVLAGYQWMTAGGNEKEVEGAQARIKTAVIGLVIVLAAYAITSFVFARLPFAGRTQT